MALFVVNDFLIVFKLEQLIIYHSSDFGVNRLMPIVVLIIKHCFIVQNVFKWACIVSFVDCSTAGFNGNTYCIITILSFFLLYIL